MSVSISYLITKYGAPNAAGSGIPEIKVILSGVDMPQSLRLRVLIVKVIALPFALASGIFGGKQGPMVHIGTLVADNVMRMPMFDCLLIHLKCNHCDAFTFFMSLLCDSFETSA